MKQGQIQQQSNVQLQKLSPQQYLLAKLVELPIADLEQRVQDELFENVALEEGHGDADQGDVEVEGGEKEQTDSDSLTDDNGADELPDSPMGDDDELPVYASGHQTGHADADIPIGDTRSFIDDLEMQIGDYDVTEHQRQLITYLIGSLDDRGFVDRPLRNIADDLLFNHNIEVDEAELEEALTILQQFEPAGIGARTLQECLLIQIDRKIEDERGSGHTERLPLLQLERSIIADHFQAFERNDPNRLAAELEVPLSKVRNAVAAIGRLNPHPGRSLHESADDRAQTIIPDFIVETDHESVISFSLNMGEVPPLRLNANYVQWLKDNQKHPADKMSRTEREALVYTKEKVDAARMFISSLQQRQQILSDTMKAVIEFQREFFLTQDDSTLRPLRLNDVASRAHANISTISRVINSKYVLLDGTLYPLKYFFLRTRVNAEGKVILRTKVAPLLREIIDGEDKQNPLSDDQISQIMRARGEAISRRTVAKYRDEMNIPSAVFRKRI